MQPMKMFAWDSTLGQFVRLTVDHATGNLNVTGGGGGGGSGPVTVADGADVAQGTTSDAPGANTVIGKLKAIAASLAGTLNVNVGNFPGTQPVSIATNTPDVTDRSARLLGHVTVDNASIAVTGFPGTQPVSGTVTVGNFPATQPVTEAALEAAIGAASESPTPYTVLDQLTQLRKLTTKQLAAIQALAPPAPKPKTYTTLMHRS